MVVVNDDLGHTQRLLKSERQELTTVRKLYEDSKDSLMRANSQVCSLRCVADASELALDRLARAQHNCWFCKEQVITVDIIGLNDDNAPIVDGTPLPLRMQCNGGYTICANCAEQMADHFLSDQQETRLCCGRLTAWPGGKHSRRCNKRFPWRQMACVLPPAKVLAIETQSVLRRERADIAREALSRIAAPGASQTDRDDDIFIFKTPCCNLAWEARRSGRGDGIGFGCCGPRPVFQRWGRFRRSVDYGAGGCGGPGVFVRRRGGSGGTRGGGGSPGVFGRGRRRRGGTGSGSARR